MSFRLDIINGTWPICLNRFVSAVFKSINRFSLINNNDSILVGVSGGKDSLALLLGLELCRRRSKTQFSIKAAKIEWEEQNELQKKLENVGDITYTNDDIYNFAKALGIDFEVIKIPIPQKIKDEGLSCYLCSKERRKALFSFAKAKACNVVALGHHQNDFSETILMNMCMHGKIDSLKPKATFFDDYTMIRPLCLVKENSIAYLAKLLELPVVKSMCPLDGNSKRQEYKSILAILQKNDKLVVEHIFESVINM